MGETPASDSSARSVSGAALGDGGQAAADERALPGAEPVWLGDAIRIYPDRRLPELENRPDIEVYAAEDDRFAGKELMAVLCRKSNLPRISAIATYQNIKNPHLLPLVGHGVMRLQEGGAERYALVFEKPAGGLWMRTLEKELPHTFSEDRLTQTVIAPMLSVLENCRNTDLVHSAIRLTNIYLTTAGDNPQIILGECLSAPFSASQPALFEPVETAMAAPYGRGMGHALDDVYAMGVCVALLARGHNLLHGKTEKEIINEKIEHGTFNALVGRERMPSGLTEFLRGVLSDDPRQRWQIEDIAKWLEGRRLSPKQPQLAGKAPRPFMLGEEKFWRSRQLAMEMAARPAEVQKAVESGDLEQWLKRSIEDPAAAKKLEWAVDGAKEGGQGAGYIDRLAARVAIAMDPHAPIVYRGLSFFPRGFGGLLAQACMTGQDLQPHAEAINNNLVNFWFSVQTEAPADAVSLTSQYENCRSYLRQKLPGYGIERVLYSLFRDCPCLSPSFKPYFVMTAPELLMALDRVAAQDNRPATVIDPHMMAFLAVRERRAIENHLAFIASDAPGQKILGVLRTLADIQKRFRQPKVPALGSWLLAQIDPVVDRFHSREIRKRVRAELVKLKDPGSLVDILNIVDNIETLNEDAQQFILARQECAALTREQAGIIRKLAQKQVVGRSTGRQVAKAISVVLAGLIILGLTIMHFDKG